DTLRNAVIVKGTAEQVQEVQGIIKSIGEEKIQGNTRVITLDKGSANSLAEELKRLMEQMRDNPVRIVVPDSNEAPKKIPPPTEKPGSEEEQDEPPQAKKPTSQLSDPQKPANKPETEKKGSPVTITARGNRLIITSDDP